MTSISRRRRLLALLLVPFMMVLAGCGKFDATFDIKDAETIDVTMDIGLDTSLIGSEYSSAEEMCAEMEGEESGVAGEIAPTVEPYEADGMYGCKITGVVKNEEFGNGLDLVEEDGEYHFTLDPAQAGLGDLADPTLADYGFEFSMTFIFPGEIIESSGGQIDGSTVVFTDAAEIANGIDIRAEANSFPWVIVIIAVVVIGFLTPQGAASFGWFAYAPLNSTTFSPGVGGDLWVFGLVLQGFGTIMGGVNFITTILCMRAPGMTMWRMPVFVWTSLITALLIIMIFPPLAAALFLCPGLSGVAGDAQCLLVGVQVVAGAAGVVDVVDFEGALGVAAVGAAVAVAFEDAQSGGGAVVSAVTPGHRTRPVVRGGFPWVRPGLALRGRVRRVRCGGRPSRCCRLRVRQAGLRGRMGSRRHRPIHAQRGR